MGFRFRKSFGNGPFRITVSKSGVGYSAGTKGFRVTKKAGGGTRTTASIPGTGISYVKDSGSGSRRASTSSISYDGAQITANVSEPDTRDRYCSKCYRKLESGVTICPNCGKASTGKVDPGRKPFYKRTWFAVAVLLIVLASCGRRDNAPEVEPTEATDAVSVATSAASIETEPAATRVNVSEIFANQGANALTEVTYILNIETRVFHKPGCGYADNIDPANSKETGDSRQQLVLNGYEPCGHCDP